jgi:hypothetical protein
MRSALLTVPDLWIRGADWSSSLPIAITPISPAHSSITIDEPVVVKIPISSSAKAVAPDTVSDMGSTRSASVPTPVAGVVAVHKLPAFVIRVAEYAAAVIASSATAALAQRRCWKNYSQQYRQNDQGKKGCRVLGMFHKTPPQIITHRPTGWFAVSSPLLLRVVQA